MSLSSRQVVVNAYLTLQLDDFLVTPIAIAPGSSRISLLRLSPVDARQYPWLICELHGQPPGRDMRRMMMER